jgi:hypothetical protein
MIRKFVPSAIESLKKKRPAILEEEVNNMFVMKLLHTPMEALKMLSLLCAGICGGRI